MVNNISRRENLGYLIFRVSKVFSLIETLSACVIMKKYALYNIQKNIYRQNYTRYINGILADYNPVL